MQYTVVTPNTTRKEKREKRIRNLLKKKSSPSIDTQISIREEWLKEHGDEDQPTLPALMVNTILWDAIVESLEIWKKVKAEGK